MEFDFIANLLIACTIGTFSAFAELLSRYKRFKAIITSGPSVFYLTVNALASGIAYYLIYFFKVIDNPIWQVIVAGTSALVILRSSFANIKVGDKNIDAGIGSIMQVFLNYADRSFDQLKSNNDFATISVIMSDIDFEKAKLALPLTCFALMSNVSLVEQEKISNDVADIEKTEVDNLTKSIILGTILAKMTETDLLKTAVDGLRPSIRLDYNLETTSDTLSQELNDIITNFDNEN